VAFDRGGDEETLDALALEEAEAVLWSEYGGGGREGIGGQSRGGDDGGAGDDVGRSPDAGIEQVVPLVGLISATGVVAGATDGGVAECYRVEERVWLSGMAQADLPGCSGRIFACEVEIAARVDREVATRREFASREIDRQPFRDGTKVEDERLAEVNRASGGVESDVAISWPGG
jgi:hypothetical protein